LVALSHTQSWYRLYVLDRSSGYGIGFSDYNAFDCTAQNTTKYNEEDNPLSSTDENLSPIVSPKVTNTKNRTKNRQSRKVSYENTILIPRTFSEDDQLENYDRIPFDRSVSIADENLTTKLRTLSEGGQLENYDRLPFDRSVSTPDKSLTTFSESDELEYYKSVSFNKSVSTADKNMATKPRTYSEGDQLECYDRVSFNRPLSTYDENETTKPRTFSEGSIIENDSPFSHEKPADIARRMTHGRSRMKQKKCSLQHNHRVSFQEDVPLDITQHVQQASRREKKQRTYSEGSRSTATQQYETSTAFVSNTDSYETMLPRTFSEGSYLKQKCDRKLPEICSESYENTTLKSRAASEVSSEHEGYLESYETMTFKQRTLSEVSFTSCSESYENIVVKPRTLSEGCQQTFPRERELSVYSDVFDELEEDDDDDSCDNDEAIHHQDQQHERSSIDSEAFSTYCEFLHFPLIVC